LLSLSNANQQTSPQAHPDALQVLASNWTFGRLAFGKRGLFPEVHDPALSGSMHDLNWQSFVRFISALNLFHHFLTVEWWLKQMNKPLSYLVVDFS
jgi:hypothetical protein